MRWLGFTTREGQTMRYQPKCVYLQGNHCIKLGAKCIERRFWGDDVCQMRESIKFPKPPKPRLRVVADDEEEQQK